MGEPAPVLFDLKEIDDDGTVLRWLVAEGESVKQGEPLVEIETDKVVFELPAPRDGVLLEIARGKGATLHKGDTLGWIGPAGSIAPEKTLRSARVRIHGRCSDCGNVVAVNGPWSSATCHHCGHSQGLDAAWWKHALELAMAGRCGDPGGLGEGRYSVFSDRTPPTCHNCKTSLSVVAPPAHTAVCCDGCELPHAVAVPPAWLAELDPNVAGTIGALDPTSPRRPDACPHCAAAIPATYTVATPRCPQCNADVFPRERPPLSRPWSLLYWA